MENAMPQKLMSALLAAQRAFGKVLKDSVNPHLKNRYAALDSVLDAIRDPLLDAGVLLFQPLIDTGERDEHGLIKFATVKTILVHAESGESYEILTSIPLSKADAQGFGSAATYARRYAIMGLLGLAPEDDDGNAASSSPRNSGSHTASRPAANSANRQASRGTAQRPAPTLSEAMERIQATEPEKLDFAAQWARVHFQGEELNKLLAAVEARKSKAA